MIIGICGNSGSGKSTLANKLLKTYGDKAIHCEIDKIGHKALTIETVKRELVNCFGSQILKEGNIDRKELGKTVFASEDEMAQLTKITWGFMEKEIDEIIKNNNDKLIILDWLLLPKSKYFNMCSLKILLDVPYETRKKRAILRDNITEDAFDLREKARYKYNPNDFNFIINNDIEKEYERLVKLL